MTRAFIRATLTGIVCYLLLGGSARAGTGADGFDRGNARYAAGDFTGAAEAYEGQVRGGDLTANLFYNLADAYYRQGNRGRAILNYERALIMDPSHAEAAANLAFVRGSKSAVAPRIRWVGTTLPWLTAAAGWLAVAGLVVAVSGPRRRVVGYGLMVAGLLVCVAGMATIWSLDDSTAIAVRAVVISDSTPALYAPADNSKVITTLTAGGEVRVLSDQGAWVYALLADGTRAWLASDKIERLVPR